MRIDATFFDLLISKYKERYQEYKKTFEESKDISMYQRYLIVAEDFQQVKTLKKMFDTGSEESIEYAISEELIGLYVDFVNLCGGWYK